MFDDSVCNDISRHHILRVCEWRKEYFNAMRAANGRKWSMCGLRSLRSIYVKVPLDADLENSCLIAHNPRGASASILATQVRMDF